MKWLYVVASFANCLQVGVFAGWEYGVLASVATFTALFAGWLFGLEHSEPGAWLEERTRERGE